MSEIASFQSPKRLRTFKISSQVELPMQFVANGPDIPEALLQAHEEGRVIFFCGAGISYPAGLPGFKGLVNAIYDGAGTVRSDIEQRAFEREQFDATLDLLERRLPGQRIAVRQQLPEALKPKWRRKGATTTHEALLELARCRDGSIRLVTTNFDRIFERVGKRPGKAFQAYTAPMLPIPKNSRWNGLVYLHGLLPEVFDATALHRLVLTSGDFGLAYLTERWAARFVSELFRNYMACFVGYSINDPVLRYMMDALAADRMLGEVTLPSYALGDCEPGQESVKTIEWSAKGVTPILYEVPAGSHDHSTLHQTLKVWAETYRDGVFGTERIVVDYALAKPGASTRQDDFVGRLLWAVSHESGLPAKRFAEFNPAPALEWLEAFSTERYRHHDLSRFGVPPQSEIDRKLQFSLLRRPTPYPHAPSMALVTLGINGSRWDDVMFQMARWLVRHLNDPAMIIWVAERGGQPHDRLLWLIEQELDRFARLSREGKTAELDDIRTNSPNAIPSQPMIVLWRLLLTRRVKSPWIDLDLYDWKRRLERDGLVASLRLELRESLSPRIRFKRPFRWEESAIQDATRIDQLVDCELVLAADHVHSIIAEFKGETWQAALPALLEDFQQLLRDALGLLDELGATDGRSDRSYWDLPSIAPHWQNREYRDWIILIELLRDAWLALRKVDLRRAERIALAWFEEPHATFKRLALFAASQDDSIDGAVWVEWLLSEDSWWLWASDTRREVMRLLVQQGADLSRPMLEKLEDRILAGPPRSMYRDDLEPVDWQSLVDQSIWFRLAKLEQGGAHLGEDALLHIGRLFQEDPRWHLEENESDEFSHWMSGSGDPDYEGSRHVDISPRTRTDLVEWLKQHQSEADRYSDGDTWRETCRTRFYHACFALCDLARERLWPVDRWREALQVWCEPALVVRSWRYAAPLLHTMPEAVLEKNAHSLTRWMEAAAKVIDRHESILVDLSRRVLALPFEPSEGIHWNGKAVSDPVTSAINHPIGNVIQALLNYWFKRQPNDNDLLPMDIEPLFTQVCDVELQKFRHGRVVLASRLIALFRVDRLWTEKNLLPIFDWSRDVVEANAAWQGFLWSPRLYRPLLISFKEQFLSTASHYAELGDHGRQFAAFLTYAALNPAEGYTSEDFRAAIEALPQEGLHEVARTLSQALGSAGEQREDYWKNRVRPFWQNIWPKSRDLASNGIAESLALVCIEAGGAFPEAVATIENWLQPIDHPHYVVHKLHKSKLSGRFPEPVLRLLDAIVFDQPWASREVMQCLEAIANVEPNLKRDHRYMRLFEYARRRGS